MKRRTILAGKYLRWIKSPLTEIWSVTIPTPDGPKAISTGVTCKKKANEFIRSLKLQWIAEERFQKRVLGAISGCKRITVRQAIAKWAEARLRHGTIQPVTMEMYRGLLMSFAKTQRLLNEQPLVINEEHITGWINVEDSTKASTRNLRLSLLKMWFDWLIAERYAVTNFPRSIGRINLNILSHEQIEVQHKTAMTEEEVNRLIAYIDEQIADDLFELDVQFQDGRPRSYCIQKRIDKLRFWRVATYIGWFTGLRLRDVCNLEWASISNLKIVKHTSKTHARVEIEMQEDLGAVLATIPKTNDRWCFFHQHVMITSPKHRAQMSGQFVTLCERAGMKHSFHDLRCSAGDREKAKHLALGATEPEAEQKAAELLGHSHVETTRTHYLTNDQAER